MSAVQHAAGALASGLPPLLVEAERVAATVAQGLHGRHRVGVGENFWQFRPFVAGDARSRIDWRQSARSDRLYVRETEWDAAQTVALWRDGGAGLRWRSAPKLPEKRARADLLLLALATLLLRGGERVRLMDGTDGNAAGLTGGNAALPRIAAALDAATGDFPPPMPPAWSRVVLFGDFLGDLDALRASLTRLAALPARGALMQVLDPAELLLPYSGRVRFVTPAGQVVLLAKVEAVREAYRARMEARRLTIADLCRRTGFSFLLHRTDVPPETGLLALYEALAAR